MKFLGLRKDEKEEIRFHIFNSHPLYIHKIKV